MGSGQVLLTKRPTERSHSGDETTRRLCAGVYFDREFRDLVVHRVVTDFRHRVPPSYGFDLAAVAVHAWRAWRLDALQHACVVSVLIVTAVLSPSVAITALCAAGQLRLAGRLVRLAPEVLAQKARMRIDHFLHRAPSPKQLDHQDLAERVRALKLASGGVILLVVVPVVLAGAEGTPFGTVTVWAAAVLLLIAAAIAGTAAARHRFVVRTQRPGRPRSAWLGRRLRAIENQQDETVVIYRRPPPKPDPEAAPRVAEPDDEPGMFVGSGELVHRWLPPLTVQLLRPRDSPLQDMAAPDDVARREHVEPPFQAHELVDYLRRKMPRIGHRSDPIRLPGYKVKDRVYVAAADVPSVRDQMAAGDRPGTLNGIINAPDAPLQHFLEIRVTSSGELATTAYLRVTVKGRFLSLDFAACALTRTPDDYELHARLASDGRSALLRSALGGARHLPAELTQAWHLVKAPGVLLGTWRARRAPVESPLAGPQASIREEKAADWERSTLDKPTILDHMKILEGHLLKLTEDFLRDHDVDTSDFEKRAETIISANVLNMGHMDISNSAVGPNSQVNQNGTTAPAPQGAQQ
ncbi:hypothetical protein OHR68_27340 [Spirillospora sp. NBC_00431]